MTTRDAIERRLWARAQLRGADLGFGQGCEHHMKQMIKDAARTLEQQGFLTDPDRLGVAEKNIELFVREMIEEAHVRGFNQLREITFREAQNKLCPIWPLC